MTQTLIEEVKETAIDYLKDNECNDTYGCDLHNEIFNTDYFCCYTSDCKKYLEQYGIFQAIEKVQEYEKLNFGEVTTDLSDPFKWLNMLVYILGRRIFKNNSKTLSLTYWNEYIPENEYKTIIEELQESLIKSLFYSLLFTYKLFTYILFT